MERAPAENRVQFLERSREIVAAAYELLERDGFEGLTIRAVLTRTGLARRAFYERFAGKDDLVLAVFEQTIRAAANHFAHQAEPIANPVERLRLTVSCIVLGVASLEHDARDPGNRRGAALSREHLRLAESRPRDLQAALAPLVGLIARQLADGMAAGLVREYPPQRLAALIFNLVSTTVITELVTPMDAGEDRDHREQLAGDIWDFCWRAIAAWP